MKLSLLIVAALALSLATARADDRLLRFVTTATVAGQQYNLPKYSTKSGLEVEVSQPMNNKEQEIVIKSKVTVAGDTLDDEITASLPTAGGGTKKIAATGRGDASLPIIYSFTLEGKVYGFSIVITPLAAGEKW